MATIFSIYIPQKACPVTGVGLFNLYHLCHTFGHPLFPQWVPYCPHPPQKANITMPVSADVGLNPDDKRKKPL